jgi:uncharacterized membrane protein
MTRWQRFVPVSWHVHRQQRGYSASAYTDSVGQDLELPPPLSLVRTTTLNLMESIGFPIAALVVGAYLGGRNVGLLAGLGATWLTAVIRKVVTGSVPGLVMIMVIILTLQTALAIGTGNLWIFLLHFPLANLVLCVLFARTARSDEPLAEKLAGEVISLKQPTIRQACLHRFFQGATWLWAGVFLVLGACMGALLASQTTATFLVYSVVATAVLIVLGIVACVLWLRAVLRRHQMSVRFARTLPCLLAENGRTSWSDRCGWSGWAARFARSRPAGPRCRSPWRVRPRAEPMWSRSSCGTAG